MSRKILLISLTVALAAALVGGATMAFWTSEGDAGGPAQFEAGTVTISAGSSMIFGVEVGTGGLYEIDVTTGAKYYLGETVADSNIYWPNALAYDRKNQRLYYTLENGALWFYDINTGNNTFSGTVTGLVAGATFSQGYYWYIPDLTDDLRYIRFDANGIVVADILAKENFTGSDNKTYRFGDVAMAVSDGYIYASTIGGQGTSKEFFSLKLYTYEYELLGTAAAGASGLQVAFGADGVLYGHATGNSKWYSINTSTATAHELDWSPGDRHFTDLAANFQSNWNPGDCDMMRYYVTNEGSKNVHVKLNLEGSWGGPSVSNIEYKLCAGMDPGEWERDNNTFYYLPEVPPGEYVKLCVLVCLVGPDTGNEYQGETFTLTAKAHAIQSSNYAPYHGWGIPYYGVPSD